MKPNDLFFMAGSNLKRRKGRTILTTVGVIIGVGALVLMVSLGLGLERQLLRSFQSEDVLRTITVTRIEGKTDEDLSFGPFSQSGQIVQISKEEIAQMEALEGVEHVTPDLMMMLSGRFPLTRSVKGKTEVAADRLLFTGVNPKDESSIASMLVRGRMWRPGERAVLITSGLLEMRFGLKPEDVQLDQPLVINYKPKKDETPPAPEALAFTVAGIVDSERLGMKGTRMLMPLERALELWDLTKGGVGGGFFGYEKDKFPTVEVKVRRPNDVDRVKAQLKNMGYDAMAAVDLMKMINTTFLILEGFLACVGAIGLLVALFGIANTMAMSVLERTREIGIMKALGARGKDIRRLFLLEAAWIGLIGGFVGLGGGWGLGVLFNWIAQKAFELPPRTDLFHVSPWLGAGSVAFAILVSIIAGVVPAIRASRMDPVAALRYE